MSEQAFPRSLRPFRFAGAHQISHASRLGRRFELSMWLPGLPAPASGYPVIWLLDPHNAFATLVETVRNHERMFGPVIVVGVGYPDPDEFQSRVRDLTPGASADEGCEALLRLITDELRPLVADYGIAAGRQALFGHSLGGLFVLNTLFGAPAAFDTYVAASPSIWWNDAAILARLPGVGETLAAHPGTRRLLMTVGGLESTVSPEEIAIARSDGIPDLSERKAKNRMVERATALAGALQGCSPQLTCRFVVFHEETHNSVIPAYIGRGARFALSGWFPPNEGGAP